jgi:hypothetical protein
LIVITNVAGLVRAEKVAVSDTDLMNMVAPVSLI